MNGSKKLKTYETKRVKELWFEFQNLKRMVDRIRRFQVLNSQIFATLNKYLKTGENDSLSIEHVRCFPAPVHPSVAAAHSHGHYYRPELVHQMTAAAQPHH